MTRLIYVVVGRLVHRLAGAGDTLIESNPSGMAERFNVDAAKRPLITKKAKPYVAALLAAALMNPAQAACPSTKTVTEMADQADKAIIAKVESAVLAPVISDRSKLPTLAERMAELKIPGVSVAVVRDSKLAWAAAWGAADADSCALATPETRFQAASISKAVAATTALALVEDDKLALDTPLQKLSDGWTPKAAPGVSGSPTLRQLLSHTGGVAVHGFAGYEPGGAVPTLRQVLDGSPPANNEAAAIDAAPGGDFRYSGGGYTLAELWLADTTGRAFDVLVAEKVLRPARMKASGYALPLRHRASAHNEGKVVSGGYRIHPEHAAAGLWSTASDLARFAIAMQRSLAGSKGAVLTQAMAKAAIAPVQGYYGLGFNARSMDDGMLFGHDGVNLGFEAKLVIHSENGRAIAVMTNAQGGQVLAQALIATIADAEGWRELGVKRVREVALADDARAAFTGYFAGPGFRVGISDAAGRLRLNANGEEAGELLHIGGDQLVFAAQGITLKAERDDTGLIKAYSATDGSPLRLERIGDPLATIGSVPMFLRGSMNDWSVATPLLPETRGWAAAVELGAGTHMFKLASEDWATVDLGSAAGASLEPGSGMALTAGGANIAVTLSEAGRYRFVLDLSDKTAPKIHLEKL